MIAIDADPRAVDAARRRFRSELTTGRLTVLNVGIAETAGTGTFWICEGVSAWNSFNREISSGSGEKHHAIEIQMRPFSDILDEHGVPFFLKIDIEYNDPFCIRALAGRRLPPFISAKDNNEDLSETQVPPILLMLHDAGYRRFKLISQRDFTPVVHSEISVVYRRLLKSAAHGRLRALGLSLVAKLLNLSRLAVA